MESRRPSLPRSGPQILALTGCLLLVACSTNTRSRKQPDARYLELDVVERGVEPKDDKGIPMNPMWGRQVNEAGALADPGHCARVGDSGCTRVTTTVDDYQGDALLLCSSSDKARLAAADPHLDSRIEPGPPRNSDSRYEYAQELDCQHFEAPPTMNAELLRKVGKPLVKAYPSQIREDT
jgi:hypothetical protein